MYTKKKHVPGVSLSFSLVSSLPLLCLYIFIYFFPRRVWTFGHIHPRTPYTYIYIFLIILCCFLYCSIVVLVYNNKKSLAYIYYMIYN